MAWAANTAGKRAAGAGLASKWSMSSWLLVVAAFGLVAILDCWTMLVTVFSGCLIHWMLTRLGGGNAVTSNKGDAGGGCGAPAVTSRDPSGRFLPHSPSHAIGRSSPVSSAVASRRPQSKKAKGYRKGTYAPQEQEEEVLLPPGSEGCSGGSEEGRPSEGVLAAAVVTSCSHPSEAEEGLDSSSSAPEVPPKYRVGAESTGEVSPARRERRADMETEDCSPAAEQTAKTQPAALATKQMQKEAEQNPQVEAQKGQKKQAVRAHRDNALSGGGNNCSKPVGPLRGTLDREILKLEKKAREVGKLRQRLADGEALERNQHTKIARAGNLEEQIAELRLQLEDISEPDEELQVVKKETKDAVPPLVDVKESVSSSESFAEEAASLEDVKEPEPAPSESCGEDAVPPPHTKVEDIEAVKGDTEEETAVPPEEEPHTDSYVEDSSVKKEPASEVCAEEEDAAPPEEEPAVMEVAIEDAEERLPCLPASPVEQDELQPPPSSTERESEPIQSAVSQVEDEAQAPPPGLDPKSLAKEPIWVTITRMGLPDADGSASESTSDPEFIVPSPRGSPTATVGKHAGRMPASAAEEVATERLRWEWMAANESRYPAWNNNWWSSDPYYAGIPEENCAASGWPSWDFQATQQGETYENMEATPSAEAAGVEWQGTIYYNQQSWTDQ